MTAEPGEITLTLTFARIGSISVPAMVTNPQTGGSSYFLNFLAGQPGPPVAMVAVIRDITFLNQRYTGHGGAPMAATDGLRVGDAEREAVAAELREHYAQGRLSMEDFQQRLDAAYAARTRGDLDRLIRGDLPPVRPPGTPPAWLPSSGNWRHHGRGGPGSGPAAFGARRRSRIGGISSLLAAAVSLVIVFVVLALASTFSLPGRARHPAGYLHPRPRPAPVDLPGRPPLPGLT